MKEKKLTVNYLACTSVKVRETCQTGSNCFTSVGAHFSGKSLRPVFFRSTKRHKFAKIEKTTVTNTTFIVLKIRIPQDAMCSEILEDFTEGNSISNKKVKNTFVWTFII